MPCIPLLLLMHLQGLHLCPPSCTSWVCTSVPFHALPVSAPLSPIIHLLGLHLCPPSYTSWVCTFVPPRAPDGFAHLSFLVHIMDMHLCPLHAPPGSSPLFPHTLMHLQALHLCPSHALMQFMVLSLCHSPTPAPQGLQLCPPNTRV